METWAGAQFCSEILCAQHKASLQNFDKIGMDLIPKQYKLSKSFSAEGGIKSRGISIPGGRPKFFLIFFERKIIFSFLILILSLLVFGIIKGYNFYLNRTAKSLEEKVKESQAGQNLELAQKFIEMDETIEAVQNLLKSHIYSSQFFEGLEKITIPQVQWLGLELNSQQGTASLTGRAVSYSVLAKQIVSFQEANFEVSVSGIKLTKNGVEFLAKVSFDPKILLK